MTATASARMIRRRVIGGARKAELIFPIKFIWRIKPNRLAASKLVS